MTSAVTGLATPISNSWRIFPLKTGTTSQNEAAATEPWTGNNELAERKMEGRRSYFFDTLVPFTTHERSPWTVLLLVELAGLVLKLYWKYNGDCL